MRRNAKIYRSYTFAVRKDGMRIFFPTRTVYIDMFTKLFSCSFRQCPFYGLTCDKCYYRV